MKKKLYLFAAILFFGHTAFAQSLSQETYHKSTRKYFGNTPTIENSTGHSGTGSNIDVVYYRCDWTIDPSVSKNIAGTVTVYFKTLVTNVSVLTFDFNKASFNNASLIVTYHGSNCTKSFPASGAVDTLTVNLPAPAPIAAIGTLDSVSISYSGVPPAVSGQEEGFQRKQDGLGNWYIYSLSESYEDRDWWPCKADMQDKADSMDINVTVPNTYWVAANGKLVDSTINGANRTFKFQHRYPIASYLVALGIAKYNRQYRGAVNIGGTNVPVIYYTFPDMTGGTLTTALARMDVSKTELVEFSNKYGDYPFKNEKHGYYQFGWGGGMEHQTFSAMSSGSMASWSVIAHELAHQWWGDKVSFATWNHLWLAEGFAQYSEALAAELVPAIGVTPASHLSGIKTTARATNTTPVILSAGSIANSNTIWTTNNDNAVYKRGAMIVSMLRVMMGDARFFQGCRDYLSDPLLAYKSAVTADLERNMENNLIGIDLAPFFTSWATGSGTPSYTGQYYISGKTIQFTLTQSRNPGATPFMPMPVAIKIANSGGTIDTTVIIYHYSATQLAYAGDAWGVGPAGNNFITYNLSFTPATVSIDPDNLTMATGSLSLAGAPLDVNILNFSAAKGSIGNQVNLSLAYNEPVEKVVLLKSANGLDFTEAGEMQKVSASGNVNNYRFNDALPFPSATFYRAKIFTTGREQYTGIVKVEEPSVKKALSVTPNPAQDVVNINFSNSERAKATIRVVNAEGKTVIESSTKNDFIHFDVSNLPVGIYLVQVMKPGETAETNRFMVRR